jgi:hypothetical protein
MLFVCHRNLFITSISSGCLPQSSRHNM